MKNLQRAFVLGILMLAACTPASTPIKISGTLAPPSEELIVVGRLERITQPVGCGYLHTGAIAEYTDLRVLKGKYLKDTIYVIHGCPELPRNEYAKGSGTLTSFQEGGYHLLHLTLQNVYEIGVVSSEGIEISMDQIEREGMLYFCSQVDLYSQ